MAKLRLQTESTLTDRYQTTIPDMVRKALHLDRRDKIRYTVQSDGNVLISKANETEDDPVINEFLNCIANDIKQNPQNLAAINQSLFNRIQSLVTTVEINLDEPLSKDDDLTQATTDAKRALR